MWLLLRQHIHWIVILLISLQKKSGAKFVFELHDLWPLSPMKLGGMSKWHPFIMLMQKAEDFWCTHADKVISILPKTEEYLKTRGLKEGKFCHIPNGIVLSDYDNVLPLKEDYAEQLAKLHNSGKFLIGFAGEHGIANALNVLIYAAEKLQKYKCVFCAGRARARKRKLKRFDTET